MPKPSLPLRRTSRLLLRPEDVPARYAGFEVIGAFNPAAVDLGDRIVLLVRIAEQTQEVRPGYVPLPHYDSRAGSVRVDWRRQDEIEWIDRRIVRLKPSGAIRLTFISWLLVASSRDGLTIDALGAALLPGTAYESFGVEDPRLTRIEGRAYFTYVAVSEHGIVTALGSTDDFQTFQRQGVIFCPENKDVLLFPEPIGGRYAALHRPNPQARFAPPEIWLARSPDLIHWGGHVRLLGSEVAWATAKIGGGTPPLRTERGWLTLFHGHIRSSQPGEVGAYAAAAMLLDLDQPERIVGITPQPVMVAEEDFERSGYLPDIVFPSGAVCRGNDLLVYYGAADTSTAVARFALDEMLAAI